ncbi:MAG: transglycosylase SLT domain-containing protein [Pseudomonadota bacterium]
MVSAIGGAVLAAACLWCASAPAAERPGAARPDDDTFMLLREAARQDDAAKANAYASRLPAYDIPSYVDYYRLKARLRDASVEDIRDYLKRYEGSAIADRLRNDWLLELGRKRDWANFDQQRPLYLIDDDLQVRCYAQLSRLAKGQKVADDARALLLNPASYGEACNSLLMALAQSGQFETADLLTQLRLSGEYHATGPARRVAALLRGSEIRAVEAVDVPALVLARGAGSSVLDHELFLVAVNSMARSSVKLATLALHKNAPKLSSQELAIGWANLALHASLTVAPEAYEYWQKAEGAPLSREAMQWKARVALRQGDWKMVKSTINAMPPVLRAENAWTYWVARALQTEGEAGNDAALALYRRIAEQNSFYGQLAMEELGQPVTIPPAAAPVSAAELAPMLENAGFRRALRFFSMRLRFEGTREWNWELRNMSERELLAAAEFARQNGVLDRMVNTSERTRSEFDYTQRFPAPHHDILQPTAQALGLDKAWVYGLIRQESRFIMDARSNVGASGLMQVMPATGKYVARKIGMSDFAHAKLNDMQTNILLGTNYLSMVLANAEGSQTLATAAYNAGPGRMRSWRAALARPVEGAVFAESIPFPETRQYVKNVMCNATNYAALFDNRPQSLKARLGQVAPKNNQPSELP